MVLSSGAHLGPYEVEAQIGSGGMGDVYRARDPRLDREVAIKVLRADVGERRRFELEARAASKLSHPNVIAVYDVGESEGAPYIVTELLDGRSLREAIPAGGMPARKLLDIAVQVAAGLSAAHEAGMTHRDLKPENVMLLRDGRAKILDFGLAKSLPSGQWGEETRTAEGVVAGTLAYMSPEQIQGEEVDYRSDQFSFGVVLYEMATGTHPFRRDDRVSTMSAIVRNDPPPVAAANPAIPPPVRWVIDRCLSKDRGDRYSATKDLCDQLRDIRDHLSEAASSDTALEKRPSVAKGRPWRVAAYAAGSCVAAALLVASGAAWAIRGSMPTFRFTPFATSAADEEEPAWSPDGRVIAFSALDRGVMQIFARDLQSALPAQLTKAPSDCRAPFWSPDSSRVFYWSADTLWTVPAVGGEPHAVMPLFGPGPNASISPDGGTLAYFARSDGFFHVVTRSMKDGSEANLAREPLPRQFRFTGGLRFSPNGRKLLVWMTRDLERGVEAWTVPFPSGTPRRIAFETWRGFRQISMNWAGDNRHILLSTIAIPQMLSHIYLLDAETSALRQITYGTSSEVGPSASPNGERIVFASGDADPNLLEYALDGTRTRALVATPRYEANADWSPTGRQIVYVSDARGVPELWMQDLADGSTRPVIEDAADGHLAYAVPRLSPEGQRLAYVRTGSKHIVWITNLSGGTTVPLEQESPDQHSPAWSPDGRWIAYVRYSSGRWELAKAAVGASAKPVSLTAAGAANSQTEWSPAGDRVCYTETGELHCVVADGGAPELAAVRVSSFMFARDGRSVYVVGQSQERKWELRNVALADKTEKRVAMLDLPPQAALSYIRMRPDGARFVATVAERKRDLWLLDGWRSPQLFRFFAGG